MVALQVVAGAGVLVAIAPRRSAERLRMPGFAFMTGVAYAGVVGSLLLVAGLPFDRSEFVSLVGATVVVAAGRLLRVRDRRLPAHVVRERAWSRLRLLGLGVASLVVVDSIWQPLSKWDAWSFWTPKAESIVYFGGLNSGYLHSGVGNADYPILMPALESLSFRFLGSFDTVRVHVFYALLFLGFIAATQEILARRDLAGRSSALLIVLIACAPTLERQTLSAYADIPVAVFTTLAALSLWTAAEDSEPGAWLLAAVFLAAAASTKVEGAFFATAVVLALLVAFRAERRRVRLRIGLTALAAAAMSVVPWRVWLHAHHVAGTYAFQASDLVTHPLRAVRAIGALAVQFGKPQWLLLPIVAVLVIGLALANRPTRRLAVFASVTAGFCFVALTVTYWGTSFPFEWHLRTSADRVVTTPLLLLLTFAALAVDVVMPEVDVSVLRGLRLAGRSTAPAGD